VVSIDFRRNRLVPKADRRQPQQDLLRNWSESIPLVRAHPSNNRTRSVTQNIRLHLISPKAREGSTVREQLNAALVCCDGRENQGWYTGSGADALQKQLIDVKYGSKCSADYLIGKSCDADALYPDDGHGCPLSFSNCIKTDATMSSTYPAGALRN